MNVPKIRYDNFTKEWEKVKLSSQASFLQGLKYTPNDVSNDGTIVLRSSNIQNSMVDYNDIVRVNIIIPEKLKIKENDILMCVRNGSKSLVGKTAWLSKNEEKCTWGAFMNIIRPKERNKFVYYYLNSKYFYNHVWKDLGTATVNQITKQTLESCYLNIPSIEEQEKISNTLSLLDQKIKLQSKKIEDLKLFKLSKYSSVFSKSNNKIKLSDICIIEKGKQINSDLLIEKGNYYMLNGGILPSGYLNEYNTNENTITISEGGNSCGYVNFNKTKFWCGGHCYKIISSSVNSSYLYHLLKHNEKIIMDLRVGSGLPNIQKKDLEALKLSIHKNDEQLKIGILFDTFDKKINLETNKLNKFKELKKALMQVMFV